MSNARYKEFCTTGTKADTLYREGRYREAQALYHRLLKDVERSGHVESFLAAKITLGLLLTHIRMGQLKEAVSIWTSHIEDSLFGIGIYGLEHAQTHVQDLICYDFVCAYLHSLTAQDPSHSGDAVNMYMSRVCEHYRETGEDDMIRLAVSNWKQHLNEVHGSRLPHQAAAELIKAEREYVGESVKPQPIGFPMPADWERPAGYEEMSRVLDRKKA
jgi:hypothetical protein